MLVAQVLKGDSVSDYFTKMSAGFGKHDIIVKEVCIFNIYINIGTYIYQDLTEFELVNLLENLLMSLTLCQNNLEV